MALSPEQIARLQGRYEGLRLPPSCTVVDSFFRPGVTLGENVTIRWSRVGRGATLGDGCSVDSATIGDGCVLGRGVRVDPGAAIAGGSVLTEGTHVKESPAGGSTEWARGTSDPDDQLPLCDFIFEKLPLVQVHKQWLAARGDQTLRVDYPLGPGDVVLDIGGFRGDWAKEIANRYHPILHVFEPVKQFAVGIRDRLGQRATVHAFGLAGKTRNEEITVAGESSSVHTSSGAAAREKIHLLAAGELFRDLPAEITLVKINIEGGEYELLEHLYEHKLLPHIKFLQIQFHDFIPDARSRRREIRRLLEETHTCRWNYPFIWEGWTRRQAFAPLSPAKK